MPSSLYQAAMCLPRNTLLSPPTPTYTGDFSRIRPRDAWTPPLPFLLISYPALPSLPDGSPATLQGLSSSCALESTTAPGVGGEGSKHAFSQGWHFPRGRAFSSLYSSFMGPRRKRWHQTPPDPHSPC